MQCSVTELKQQPLLRVYHTRLCWRDTKDAISKALHANYEATVPQALPLNRSERSAHSCIEYPA
jgi:hypothetical protein